MEKQRLHDKTELNNFAKTVLQLTPVYETARVGGSDHEPLFQSTVLVGEVRYCGLRAHSHKEAEASAAATALETLGQRKRSRVLLVDCDSDILTDLLTALKPEVLEVMDVYLFATMYTIIPKGMDTAINVVYSYKTAATLFAHLGYFMGCGAYERYGVASRSIAISSHLRGWEGSVLGQKSWPSGGVKLITEKQDLAHILCTIDARAQQ